MGVTGSVVSNALDSADVSAGDHQFSGLEVYTSYTIIVVAENDVDYSVKQITASTSGIAPVLNDLVIANFDMESITLARPTFSTAGNPSPTVTAYIGYAEGGSAISISGSEVSNALDSADVSAGDHQFSGLVEGTLYKIIVVAENDIDYSVMQIITGTDEAIQTSIWTWVSGSNVINQSGVYGTKGEADAANVPGGRDGSESWIDSEGNLWLFGGRGYDYAGNHGYLSDLWKFDPTTGLWTWVSGSNVINQSGVYGIKGEADAANVPGGRLGSESWIDSEGNLWLFGGQGIDNGTNAYGCFLNDLWKFNPTTGLWTWVSGSNIGNQSGVYGTKGEADAANVPGGRDGSESWIDSEGNLWLFGGRGYDYAGNHGYLSDLWKFDPTTGLWTWVSGSNVINQSGVYGTKGEADTANVPGGRFCSVSWIDSEGNLWLFGGQGIDNSNNGGYLSDLWKFDPTTGLWTWVSGSNVINQSGVYGTKGEADAANVPGTRVYSVSFIDSGGNLWLFGGRGYDYAGNHGHLNDLWKFNPTTGLWTWVSGSNVINQSGVYGTKGEADAANVPGGRYGSVSWIVPEGKLWSFGGLGYDYAGNNGYLNDLWSYKP